MQNSLLSLARKLSEFDELPIKQTTIWSRSFTGDTNWIHSLTRILHFRTVKTADAKYAYILAYVWNMKTCRQLTQASFIH